MELTVGKTSVSLVQGDITRQAVDAIVNAANSSLMGGGGVDGAIHKAGGHAILQECKAIVEKTGILPPGKAVSTTAGKLAAKRVIHTVGPVYHGGDNDEEETLESAYRSCLEIARREELRTIAFPSISTGAYKYPIKEAAAVALDAVLRYVRKHPDAFHEIRFVLYSERDLGIYELAVSECGRA